MTSSFIGDSFFGLDLKKVKARLLNFRRSVSKRVLLLDFDVTSVTLAEVQVQEGAVNFAHVRRLSLPEEALERGVPAEPRKMAGLIKDFCEECDIPAHRAAVVIPHDAVFTSVLSLPSQINAEAALHYVLDPASAAQVPVQLDQMDADLIPLGIPGKLPDTQSYFLIAIPRKLVDRIVEMLKLAEMDLLQLQVGISSQLQHCVPYLSELDQGSSILHLDLLRDCTLAALLIAPGPVKLSRLTSIRDFPDPPEADATSTEIPFLNAEAQIVGSDRYLPLSDLDLRRLVQEIKQFLKDFSDQYPDLHIASVVVSGVNSAHPSIDALLEDLLELPVRLSRPLATEGVGQFIPDTPLVLQSLGRLIGLGLSFLPCIKIQSRPAPQDQSFMFTSLRTSEPEFEPAVVASIATESIAFSNSLQEDERLYLPKPHQELLLTPSKPVELPDDAPPVVLLSHSHQDDEVGGLILGSELVSNQEMQSQHSPIAFPPSGQSKASDLPVPALPVETSENSSSVLQPIFTFDSEDEDHANLCLNSLEETSSISLETTIDLDEDQDEVPFSMQDLLSSFETKIVNSPDEQLSQEIASTNDQAKDFEDAHLVDDPALWPSISKLQVISEIEDGNLDNSDQATS